MWREIFLYNSQLKGILFISSETTEKEKKDTEKENNTDESDFSENET